MHNLDRALAHYDGVDTVEKKDLDRYYQLITSVEEAERFNYHDDYWGSADKYQEENVELMETVEPLLGEKASFDDGNYVGVVVGIAVDRQYNDIGHSLVVLDGVEEAKAESKDEAEDGILGFEKAKAANQLWQDFLKGVEGLGLTLAYDYDRARLYVLDASKFELVKGEGGVDTKRYNEVVSAGRIGKLEPIWFTDHDANFSEK